VSDSLFSMDGDLAPLADLAELARRHGAMLMIDEAHATGVLGPSGRGACELLGVEEAVHVRVGTLSKALGAAGGFVAGEARLIDWLYNRARGYVFSTAPPEPVAAAALAALGIVRNEQERRERLLASAASLRSSLASRDWNIGRAAAQIVPLYAGSPARAMELADKLQARGLFVPPIRPPSVPAGESLLRISLSAGHTETQIEELLNSLMDSA
jgi:8-amino-7-oxononanoate synthase